MSTELVDISYDLIDGIVTVLSGHVTYGGVTYPVYKSIPKPSAEIYVHVHDVLHSEDGTKDGFMYSGTVLVEVVDESRMQADKKLAYAILNVVRRLLKTSKGSTFSIGSTLTLIVFSFNVKNEFTEQAANGISRSRIIDSYNFLIE